MMQTILVPVLIVTGTGLIAGLLLSVASKFFAVKVDERVTQLREQLPGENEIAGVSEAMKQLGDPSRLRIFWLLCHCEECVLNIAAIVNMSSPAVSHHLRLLKSSGLIVSRREGKEMYYRTADTELAQMLHHMIEKIGRITCPEE